MRDALFLLRYLTVFWRSVRESNTLLYSAWDLQSHPLPSGPPTNSIFNCTMEGFEPYLPPVTVHVKIEVVYLSGFSASASITEAAHLSLFIVVTRSLVPHLHLVHKKTLPSVSLGGRLERCMCKFTSSAAKPLRAAIATLAAFSNAGNKHMCNGGVHVHVVLCLC